MSANPINERMRQLIATPVQAEEPTYGLPSRQMGGFLGLPPGSAGSLAQADDSTTEPGGPSMAAPQPLPSAGQFEQRPAPVTGSRTVSRPRPIFRSPEEAMLLGKRAAAQGDVEGEVAGLVAAFGGGPDAEAKARNLIAEKYERMSRGSMGTVQAMRGTLPDGSFAYGILDRRPGSPTMGRFLNADSPTGEPLIGFSPITGANDLGDAAELAAKELGYPSAQAAFQTGGPEAIKAVNTRALALARAKTYEQGAGSAQARFERPIDIPTAQQAGLPVGTTAPQGAVQKNPPKTPPQTAGAGAHATHTNNNQTTSPL